MKYNTKSVKNILDTRFEGKFSGCDFRFEAGQVRYLPSHIAEHLANQLIDYIIAKFRKDKKPYDRGLLLAQVLGQEIMTAEKDTPLSLQEEVARHEADFNHYWETAKKEELLKRVRALDIAEKKNAG